MIPVRPEIDPELVELLGQMPEMPQLDGETLEHIRPFARTPIDPVLEGRAVRRSELTMMTLDGSEIPISVFSPDRPADSAPCIVWLHGGGMVMGDRFSQIDIPLEWLEQLGAVVVSIEYRLAPEATGMTPVEDAYAGLLWVAEHADELEIDPLRIVIAGPSAGGGLAAGVALMARDKSTLRLAAQVLICPMLDHRNVTTSSRQYTGPGVWSREMNEFGWRSVLGGPTGSEVPSYVSPAMAEDLTGLPTTYIDAGSAEVFRDEDVEYAGRIWAAGGQVELHIWAGGFHGFDSLFPQAALSKSSRRTRTAWLAKVLAVVS